MFWNAGTVAVLAIPALLLLATTSGSAEQAPAFVAPPRTIADITAILDQDKPDPQTIAKLRADADAEPPANADSAELADFYHTRCLAHGLLGETREAAADCEKAAEQARDAVHPLTLFRMRQSLAFQYSALGQPRRALQVMLLIARDAEAAGTKGWLFNSQRHMADNYIQLGDFRRAVASLRRNTELIKKARNWPAYAGFRRANWEAEVELGKARLLEARGRFREAEASYRRTESLRREALLHIDTYGEGAPPAGRLEQTIDSMIASQGRMKARQGSLAEAEADIRRALLSRLSATGKYHPTTAMYIGYLANVLIEQGRLAEAEQLTRRLLDVLRALGLRKDSQHHAVTLDRLASIFNLQGRWQEAQQIHAQLSEAVEGWERARREALLLNSENIVTLYHTNGVAQGLATAEMLLGRQTEQLGEKHIDTALTRGLLAAGYARAGRESDALREFKRAVTVPIAHSRETDDEDATIVAARELRTQFVIEHYIALLARAGAATGIDAATESFRLADMIRGYRVQRALASSSARAAAQNPALSALVRKSQDLEKQISAQFGVLNNVLTLPPQERDENAVKALQAGIEKLRGTHTTAKKSIAARFPNYASLVDPSPPTVAEVRAALRPDEAFISMYFGRNYSFVWAVPKSGPVAFTAIPAGASEIDAKVQSLRTALEPNATMVADIPPFDVALSHDLYSLILKPVESGWKQANHLIVATNGALALLPLGLLSTAPVEVLATAEPPFSGYRAVPWLARSHAVTMMPATSALSTLRKRQRGSDQREPLIGFGDPLFNRDQVVRAAQVITETESADLGMRGIRLARRAAPQTGGIDSAQIGLLPRLPDTADELRSVALALRADPSKALHLGTAANELVVKGADLSKYRTIVFATHGLVPGELDGLHQPALALSAPDVTGMPGDGLLTMEEILALKLDADWVVLSACNTGAGAGAGSEAASGLGRAFFYAGTRAILVTNWSVHSASARELVTDLFRRQTANPELTRGEALRQAMSAVLDGPGYVDQTGKTIFSYAHPLFWAPYTIIGDGGGAR